MSLKKNSKKAAVLLALFTLLSTSTYQNVFADEPNTAQNISSSDSSNKMAEDIIKLREWLSSYNVDDDTIDSLINKLEQGEIWDSLNPEKANLGVSSKINNEESKIVYPDGSIAITGLEKGIEDRKINIGSVSSGTGYRVYKNCKVYHNAGIVNLEFYANYTIAQGAYDKIDGVRDARSTSLGGVATRVSFGRKKIQENANGPAKARFEVFFVSYDNKASGNYWIDLDVGKDTAKSYYTGVRVD